MTTTLPAALRAPFSAGGASAIDAQLANRLLAIALEAGGEYADIYFEFRVSADYALEEEQVRTLGRGITLGLGVTNLPSLGDLLRQGKDNLDAWWISVPTFIVLVLTLLLLTFIGDALRDAFDTRKS